jgi:hypothetical protein
MTLWIPVLILLAFGYVCVFARRRAASRTSRMEERIVRRYTGRVYQLDHTQIPLALRKQRERVAKHRRFKGGGSSDAEREVPVPHERGLVRGQE